MKCKALVRTCRQCGKRYDKWDRTNPCSECGTDRKCGNNAIPGWKWCDRHGGPAPGRNFYGIGRGIVSGVGSHFPISRLAAKYNQMQKEGTFLSNRHSIEVVRGRIAELLERIDLDDAPERMQKLHGLWQEYLGHLERGKEIEAGVTRKLITSEFDHAYHDYMAWKEIYKAVDLDRKLVESQVKIAKDIQAMITAEDAYEMVAQIFAAIMRIENDPQKLKRYQHEFATIVGDGSVREDSEGGE